MIAQTLPDRLGHTKVDHFHHGDRIVHRDDDIGWLEVSVDDPFLVSVLDITSSYAYYMRSRAYWQLGKHDLSLADLLKSVEFAPTNPMLHNQLAWYSVTGRERTYSNIEQGVQHARRAVELGPNYASFWNTLGVALYYSDQWQEAIDALQKSIELPKDSESHSSSLDYFFLSMAHWQLNQNEEARKWYDQAVDSMEKNKNKSQDEELLRFRDEATKLLNIVP